jgi:hypothetical protein
MDKATKGRGGWGWLAVIVLLTVLPWVILLAWLGLVPGLSDLMGLNEAKDLGVKVSVNDARTFESKSGIQLDKVKRDIFSAAAPVTSGQEKGQIAGQLPGTTGPSGRTMRIARPANLTLSQEELTAVLNQAGSGLIPMKDMQVKLGKNTVEVSGKLDTSHLGEFLGRVGVKPQNIERISQMVSVIGGELPVYVKAHGGVENALLNLQFEQMRVGNLELPTEKIAGGIRSDLRGKLGNSIRSVTFQNGALDFAGSLPAEWFGAAPKPR